MCTKCSCMCVVGRPLIKHDLEFARRICAGPYDRDRNRELSSFVLSAVDDVAGSVPWMRVFRALTHAPLIPHDSQSCSRVQQRSHIANLRILAD